MKGFRIQHMGNSNLAPPIKIILSPSRWQRIPPVIINATLTKIQTGTFRVILVDAEQHFTCIFNEMIRKYTGQLHENTFLSKLAKLGWSPFFQHQYENSAADSAPARVVGVHRHGFSVMRGDEVFHVSLAGRLYNQATGIYPVVGDWVTLGSWNDSLDSWNDSRVLRMTPWKWKHSNRKLIRFLEWLSCS